MPDNVPPLKSLLSHRLLGRILQPDGVGAELLLIRRAWEAEGNPLPKASDFAFVGRGSGTHLLKLASPRAGAGQSVVRVVRSGANRHPSLVPSIDAKKARVAKIVFRPLEVAGFAPRHIVEHVLNPDELSPIVLSGFAAAFGQDALDALRDALTKPLQVVGRLPVAEFPIVFLPRPGGGDLQASPLAPAEAYIRMEEVTAPFFLKREEGQSPRRGSWHRQEVSAKPQNISGAVGKRRTRFMAQMPRALSQWEAELHRYAHGGSFPRWRDDAVAEAVMRYADLLDRSKLYSNQDIRQALDRRADALIHAAREFMAEVAAEVGASQPEGKPPSPPSVIDLIVSRQWKGDGRARARMVLTSEHFRKRLAAVGG